MIPGIPGGGYSVNPTANANTSVGQSGAGAGISVGGINTGVQGLDLQTLLIVAGVIAVVMLVFRK